MRRALTHPRRFLKDRYYRPLASSRARIWRKTYERLQFIPLSCCVWPSDVVGYSHLESMVQFLWNR